MRFRAIAGCLLMALASISGLSTARAQGPTIDMRLPTTPGGTASRLGPSPGAGVTPFRSAPGVDSPIAGGRPGPSTPRINPDANRGGVQGDIAPGRIAPTVDLPASIAPIYGSLAIPAGEEDLGPPDGLTLDAAIEILKRNNLDLLSKSFEIPQAQADILTASLRANPFFYADAQLIPYGRYTQQRPGGPPQYDVNVSIPLDVTQKRKYRTIAAVRAKCVLEAQFQDAVRTTIDNLYSAYVNVLAARETLRYTKASVQGLDELVAKIEDLFKTDFKNKADLNRARVQRNLARIALADAEQRYGVAKRELSTLLNLPPQQAEALEVRGRLLDLTRPALQGDDLVRAALENRPDVVAFRLGVRSAEANVGLQRANRLPDLYLLAQPYTFQDNSLFGLKSVHSWAVGITAPMPLFNRNQGNIRRAELNVAQTQVDVRNAEAQAIRSVKLAEREYLFTREALEHLRAEVLPEASQVYQSTRELFEAGEKDPITLLEARREFNDTLRLYLDALVRHRRAMLGLNTAVGRRILP